MMKSASRLARGRNLAGAVCAIAAMASLDGCAGRGGSIPYDPPGFVAPDPLAGRLPALPAVLSPGDLVTVRVYRVDSLSGEQIVDSAGRIKVPLIGTVRAAGRTTDDVEVEIARDLGARYLSSPQVQVTLKSPMQRMVTLDGTVQQPGVYAVPAETTLMQAIAMAHGTADGANIHRVVVFRTIKGQRMAATFDLGLIRHGKSPDPVIYPEDIVVVDGSTLTSTWKLVLQSLPFIALFRPFG